VDTLHARRAGIDVPKAGVVVRVRLGDRPGKVAEEVRTFPTTTRDLVALSDWPAEHGVTHLATESTGVYWGPVFNLPGGRRQVILVNAGHTGWWRQMPVRAARAASPTKGTDLAAPHRRLARRRGEKRALVAVGHTLPVMICRGLKKGTPCAERGADFLDRQEPERLTRQLVKRLESPGHQVTPEPRPPA
jgi:hypothetical protein